MSEEPEKYFLGDTIQPGQPLDIALLCRSFTLTNIALASLPSSSAITVVKATVEEKTIPIAYLSRRNPQCRLNMDFTPQKMSVRLEIDGTTPVHVLGYVHDVDVASLNALKRQMGLDQPVEVSPFDPFDVQGYTALGEYVRYKDVTVGTGAIPMKGERVAIAYTIVLPNGVEIHSKDKQNLPIKTRVQVAVAKMCPGVDKVLQTMREGGERVAVIRPEWGYGKKGMKTASIPPDCTFRIHVKLLR
ncbi:hypothetical protein WA556_005556, partial [Blastocystis sp. ATCC 50177/Nand II]